MKDPARLVQQGANDAESRLLNAGIQDDPPKHSVERAAAILGLSAGAVLTTSSVAAVSSNSKLWALVKWVGVGASGAGAVGFIALQLLSGTPTSNVGASTAPEPPTGQPALEESETRSDGAAERLTLSEDDKPEGNKPILLEDLLSESDDPEPAAKAQLKPRTMKESHESTERAASTFKQQKELIGLALEASSRGDTQKTLKLVDQYDRAFPGGVFASEATTLRIEALARSGRQTEARKLAGQFLARHPESPYRKRIESALGRAIEFEAGPTPGHATPCQGKDCEKESSAP